MLHVSAAKVQGHNLRYCMYVHTFHTSDSSAHKRIMLHTDTYVHTVILVVCIVVIHSRDTLHECRDIRIQ